VIRIFYNGEEIRQGFIKEIQYNERLDGILMDNFLNTIYNKIDQEYKFLQCENFDIEKIKIKNNVFPNKNKQKRFFDWD
jgi:hypothetical protein